MKEYLEQRIEYYEELCKSGFSIEHVFNYNLCIQELTAALNHLNKIENEKS